jgi:hypothetical protein
MKFKNLEEAKNAYLNGNKLAKKASKQANFKSNNKVIRNQVIPAFNYLKSQNELKILIPYLEQNDDTELKQLIAVALLPYYEDIAVKVLEDIFNSNVSSSFIAGMVLEQWKKGTY